MSQIISATAPCSWGVWYADGTPSKTPYPTCLDQAARAGYQALELGPDGYLPTDEGKLKEELTAHSLYACAGTACYRFDREPDFSAFRSKIDRMCKRLRTFDASYIVAMDESDVGRYSEKKEAMPASVWDSFFTKIREMATFARDEYGIEVVYHPHIKSMVETNGEIVRLLEYTGVNLCLDIGHHAYVNGNGKPGDTSVFSFLREHKERIAYLHFKNISYQIYQTVCQKHLDSDAAFDMDVMCDLAEGIIDYMKLKEVLDEINYRGIGVIEQDMPKASTKQAFAAAVRNLEYLKGIHMIGAERDDGTRRRQGHGRA